MELCGSIPPFLVFAFGVHRAFCPSTLVDPERALIQFHEARIRKLWPLWKKVFDDLGIPCKNPVLVQTVNRHLFNEILIQFLTSRSTPKQPTQEHIAMSATEENAIRYASGYVPFKLLQKLKKLRTNKAAAFVECLTNMAVGGDVSSYYQYTTVWLHSKDKGGLFRINDATILFFRAVEHNDTFPLTSEVHLSLILKRLLSVVLWKMKMYSSYGICWQWTSGIRITPVNC